MVVFDRYVSGGAGILVVDQVLVMVPLHSVLVAVDQVVAVPVVAVAWW